MQHANGWKGYTHFLDLLKHKILILTAIELIVFSSTSEVKANTDCSNSPTYNVELQTKINPSKFQIQTKKTNIFLMRFVIPLLFLLFTISFADKKRLLKGTTLSVVHNVVT